MHQKWQQILVFWLPKPMCNYLRCCSPWRAKKASGQGFVVHAAGHNADSFSWTLPARYWHMGASEHSAIDRLMASWFCNYKYTQDNVEMNLCAPTFQVVFIYTYIIFITSRCMYWKAYSIFTKDTQVCRRNSDKMTMGCLRMRRRAESVCCSQWLTSNYLAPLWSPEACV